MQPSKLCYNNSQPDTFFVVEVGTLKALLPQDINPYGRSSRTNMPLVYLDTDFLTLNSSSPMSECLQMSLSLDCQSPIYSYLVRLVQTFPALAIEPELMAVTQACFLKDSDFCDFKGIRHLSLRMSLESSVATTDKTSTLSLAPSLNWGIWVAGRNATALDTSPKTENEFSLSVFTGDVRCNLVEIDRPFLTDCLDDGGIAVIDRARGGDRTYSHIAPTIRTASRDKNGKQGGSGAFKVLEEDGSKRPLRPHEVEKLMGWEENATATGITSDGEKVSISNTQRHRMLGNGIIPAEIENICNNLRPFLEDMADADTNQNRHRRNQNRHRPRH